MISIRSLLTCAAVSSVAAGCSKPDPAPAPPVPVTVGTAERRAVPFDVAANGTVEPMQTVAVQPQVSGPILRIAFHEGDEVRKGQVLFQLDRRPFQAALQQAAGLLARDRAQAANAEDEARRYASLAEKEYVTAQQNDAARTSSTAATATVSSSQAAVEQARLNLQYTTIRAPISGRTGSLRVREGNLVRTTDAAPLATINQIRPILVRFAVPAAQLPAIQRHQGDTITVLAQPTAGGAASSGTLAFVDNAVDTTTGTILLKARFPNADGALWPGGFVYVRLRLFIDDSALVVPAAAVVSGQQGSFVFIIRGDSSAGVSQVTVDRTAGDLAIVRGEVRPGDRVVTDGQLRLREGSKVQIKAPRDSVGRGDS